MAGALRNVLIIVVLLLLVPASYLILTQRHSAVYSNYSSQSVVCQLTLPVGVNSNQTVLQRCTVIKGDWITLSLRSSANITVTVLANGNTAGAVIVIFNQTATSVIADFPFNSNESLIITIANHQLSPTVVNGIAEISGVGQITVKNVVAVNPYKNEGYALAGVSLVSLFFLVWNPNKSITRRLDRISSKRRGTTVPI